MKRRTAIVMLGLLVGCAATSGRLPPPPTTMEIVQMAKGGESPEAIIARMEQSYAVYQLPASELARLREQGVPDKVIDYMQQTYIDSVRYRERERMRGAYFYPSYVGPYRYPYWRFPYW
jgi:hypothetical protein